MGPMSLPLLPAPASLRRLTVVANHLTLGISGTTTLAEKRVPIPSAAAGGFFSDARSLLYSSVDESDAHIGDRIAQVLNSHGVKFLFCLSGGHISPILAGAEAAGIRVVDVRHEVNAVFAADAVARLTGVPGVAAVTAGPGVTNTVTAVKNAAMAQSPLVLLGGAAPLAFTGRGALQDIDQRSILGPVVKKYWHVRVVRDVVPSLREAFCEAASGVPGPVFVELPLDILYSFLFLAANVGLYNSVKRFELNEADHPRVVVPTESRDKSKDEYLAALKPTDSVYLIPQKQIAGAVRAALQLNFRYRFAGARQQVDVSPLPLSIPLCPQRDLETTAGFLRGAKKPVFVLGSQCTLRPDLTPLLAGAVKTLGAPVFLGGMSRGLLGRESPYFIRQNRSAALKASDLVIIAGTVVDFRLGYGASLPSAAKAKIVAVSRDQAHLDLNRTLYARLSGGGWTATLASLGDPCDFLIRLAEMCPGGERYNEWASALKADEAKTEAQNRHKGTEDALGRGAHGAERLLNPIGLLQTLEDELPSNAIFIGDGGDFVSTAAYVVRPRGPLQWLDPGSFGTLGVGGGFALGAKLARPETEVWLLWGDGAAGYSIAEFDTFTRHKVPVLALVGNDACWGQIERDQTPWFGTPVACDLDYTRYERVAEGFGGVGFALTSAADDVAATIREARQKSAKCGLPVLINALIGRTNFREGSISV